MIKENESLRMANPISLEQNQKKLQEVIDMLNCSYERNTSKEF